MCSHVMLPSSAKERRQQVQPSAGGAGLLLSVPPRPMKDMCLGEGSPAHVLASGLVEICAGRSESSHSKLQNTPKAAKYRAGVGCLPHISPYFPFKQGCQRSLRYSCHQNHVVYRHFCFTKGNPPLQTPSPPASVAS